MSVSILLFVSGRCVDTISVPSRIEGETVAGALHEFLNSIPLRLLARR